MSAIQNTSALLADDPVMQTLAESHLGHLRCGQCGGCSICLDLSLASLGCSIGLLALLGDGSLGVLAACSVLVALLLNMARNIVELAGCIRLDCCVCNLKHDIGGAEEGGTNCIMLGLLDLEGCFNLRLLDLLLAH
jgi:hypothetical protein